MADLYRKAPHLESTEVVLDVRTPAEFSAGHVKGSLNIPHDQVGVHLDKLKPYKHLYIHCRSGKRAEAAAQTLLKAGFSNLVCHRIRNGRLGGGRFPGGEGLKV